MQSHFLHVISKISTLLASTCKVTSYTSYQNPKPFWQVHAKSLLTRHIKISTLLASTCKVTSYTSYQNLNPSGKYMQGHFLHVISKSQPFWQVHAKSLLTRHIKMSTLLASTCKVTSYTSYQNLNPSGKYMQSHFLHVISKSQPFWQVHAKSLLTRHIKISTLLASTCKVTSYTSYQNLNPSGKYMQSHFLHVISQSQPFWQIHAKSLLTRHIKISTLLASTCKVTSYTSYQNLNPSGKYMQSHFLHVISKSQPFWQVHAKSLLTRHLTISTLLASTCKVTSYTSYQNLNPSGKYMQSHFLHVISKSQPFWQVHAKSLLTRHIKISTFLASTCKVTSYTSYQNLNHSGKYMQSHFLHVISKSQPFWQVHAQWHLTRHIKISTLLANTCKVTSYTSYQNLNPSGKYMQSHFLHVISKSQPFWQVHAKSLLTRHIKISTLLASTCKVTSCTSYPNLNPSGKYMQSHILHVVSESQPPLHLTRHIKTPHSLASTCKVTSYTSSHNLNPSGKYMQSHFLHVISKSQPFWQVHAKSHLTRHIKIPPPLASTCTVTSYTSYQNPTPSSKCIHSHILDLVFES